MRLRPGRAWVDGILTRLAGRRPPTRPPPSSAAPSTLGPPIAAPAPTPDSLGDGVRDAVILEVSEEALNAFQYPEQLIEPALGGPDTSERAFVNLRLRLLRLADGEDCSTIGPGGCDDDRRQRADSRPARADGRDRRRPSGRRRRLHRLRALPLPDRDRAHRRPGARFKWSQFNGGLVGRGRFDATVNPATVRIDAGRAAIVHSGLTGFYLEALQYDELDGTWNVVYGAMATLNADNDLDLATRRLRQPAGDDRSGVLPPLERHRGHRVVHQRHRSGRTARRHPPRLRPGRQRQLPAGDYWTFKVRAGEIANLSVLVDTRPPEGIVYHRVPLAEINWTGRLNTDISGTIEDCRKRFRPLTNQKICCTFLVGDGVTSFGDFNSLEAAAQLPAAGGELCLLPGMHRANLRLEGRATSRSTAARDARS